jgi:hypothetical protein
MIVVISVTLVGHCEVVDVLPATGVAVGFFGILSTVYSGCRCRPACPLWSKGSFSKELESSGRLAKAAKKNQTVRQERLMSNDGRRVREVEAYSDVPCPPSLIRSALSLPHGS